MASRSVIKVLRNLLGLLTSRYSNWQGYWVYGFVVSDLEFVEWQLLVPFVGLPDTSMATIRSIAATRFSEQVFKAGLDPVFIREATLTIERLTEQADVHFWPKTEISSGKWLALEPVVTPGYRMRFKVSALTDLGRRQQSEETVAVAPHDPIRERRSLRLTNEPY